MNIAILGIGKIGSTLGRKWAKTGHNVMAGVRDMNAPNAQALLTSSGDNLSLGTLDQAIAFAEIVVFAVPGTAVASIVEAHAGAIDGKIIIDATNNIGATEMSGIGTFTAQTPTAKVFRAFNTLGWENFAEPQFGNLQAVERLIADIGLNPMYVGGLEQVQLLDAVVRLWFSLAVGQKLGRHLAFKVLTSPGVSS
jgi:predicted dinucleotide-binding enzyme